MDSRPRNNNGQFAPGGMDPNTTSAAYNPQIIEARKATLAEKLRRAIGVRRGVEESVPLIDSNVVNERIRGTGGAVLFNHGGHGEHGGVKLRLRELARQAAYDPYAMQTQPAEPGQAGRDFRNAALGIGALGAGGGVAYAGFRGAQAARSAQTLTDDALKTSGEARKAARTARVAAARFNRAGKVIKTQLTTFPTFKKVASKIFEGDLKNLKELAARSVELSS